MKCFCVLLLVAVSHAALLSRSSRSAQSVPAPTLIKLTAIDPNGFNIQWEPVKSESDPVIGYKVKVWEQPRTKVYKYEIINGVKVLVEELVPAKFPAKTEPPSFEPKEIIITKAAEHSAQSKNLEDGLIYEFRVQAITAKGDGPLSSSMRLEYPKPKHDEHKKDLYVVA